jgi:hypothetical protein
MNLDEGMERLYRRVELVRGAGDRRRGQLCIMSFVALLAGEGHTDEPRTASAVIRRYAMTINDEMPADIRQRLKPFAPRILHTRDGHDWVRARLLLESWQTEVLSRIAADFGQTTASAERRAAVLLPSQVASGDTRACEQVASSVARLMSHFATIASPTRREWYWLKAIDLLDRLCDVGHDISEASLDAKQVSLAEMLLERGYESKPAVRLANAALAKIRSLVPSLTVGQGT